MRLADSRGSGRFGGVVKSRSRPCSRANRTNAQWLEEGYEHFGVVPFLVKQVHRPEAEPVHYFSCWC
jgi:hypothetical protein